MKDKIQRGFSTIIATILILLLTVVIAGLLAKYSVPFVKDSIAKSTECINYGSYFKFDDSFSLNCIASDKSLLFSVKAENLDGVIGFNIILFGDGESKLVEAMNNTQSSGLKMYNDNIIIDIPAKGETRSYKYNDGKTYTGMEIHPVLNLGKVCEKASDRISIGRC